MRPRAVTFDARTGSVAVIDAVALTAPIPAEAATGASPARLPAFDFESLMPENLLNLVNRQELRDLFSFLETTEIAHGTNH